MKIKIIINFYILINSILLVTVASSPNCNAQTIPVKQWDKRFGGTIDDQLKSLQQTSDGGFILGGFSWSGAGGDKTEGSRGAGYTDYWVVKTDAVGNKVWDKTFGGSGSDAVISLKQTNDGGYILGGSSSSGADGDRTESSRGGGDFWMVKTDAAGNKQWDKRFGGSGGEYIRSIQQTIDGGFILGGWSNSGAGGDKTEASRGNNDYWIVKTDAAGNKQWDKRFGGAGDDGLYSIQQTNDGGYILGGESNSNAGGDKTEASKGAGYTDYWVVKTDAAGNKVWDKTFGGSDSDVMMSLQQTNDGGYILGGWSNSGADGDKTEPTRGYTDYWMVKTDAAGNKLWDKRFGGNGGEIFATIQQTIDGGYILGGYTESHLSGDLTETYKGNPDYWIVKTDAAGNKQWDKRIGSNGLNYLYSLQQTSDGGYLLGGEAGEMSIDPNFDKTEATRGGFDYWIVKLGTAATTLSPIALSADQVTASSGSQVVVPIRVSDFTNILTAQGTITFDPAVVTFANVEQFAFADMTSSNFGVTQAATGKITFSWDDADLTGENLVNNAVLFALRFNVIGAPGTVSPVQFTSVPTPLEFTNAALNTLTVNPTNGSINVLLNHAVSGLVRSEHNTPINTVTLTTSGGTVQSSTTNATGAYSFNFNGGGTYAIVAAKSNDVVANNGVTTLDIALVRRHILGVQALASPYKILAADVNASDAVTTADIAQMRSLILTTTTSFSGQQWKFVPSNYTFTTPTNPFPFNSTISTLSLSILSSSQTVDFIGLKLGDVNNTWDNTIARLQAAGDIYMLLPGKQVQPQDTVVVPVRVKDFTNVSGYQFTMEWDKQVLQYIGVVPAALQGAYGQHQVSNGKLTTTWDEPAGQSLSLTDSTIVFQLKFKAIGSIGSSSALNITSSLTKAESYNHQLAPLNLLSTTGQVQIGTVTGVTEGINQGYAFFQNYPNPFSTNTTFSFTLPKAEKVTLTIYNSLGQTVAIHTANYSAGEHQLELKELKGKNLKSGTYFISITAGEFTSTKKIVVLK